MQRTLALILIPAVALILGAGIQVGRALPPVQLSVSQSPIKLPGAFKVTFPSRGQAAVGEESLGLAAETPNQEPVAIASLTKMMTAYLLLQAQPLKTGEDGPITTLSAADVKEYEDDKAKGDSVAKVSVGEKLSERQLLEALLLPSADNIATLIANQVAGNETEFVKKMNKAAQTLGMTRTSYTDVAGVNPATASTASDQLKMAQEAMQNRIFRDIVSMPQANLPVAGVVYNVNFMVGKQGMSGVKTGSTLAAGSCFVGSYPIKVNGTSRILLGVVLGQQSLHDALNFDATMLHAVAPQFRNYPLATPEEGFAQITAAWAQQSKLELGKPLHVFGYPGMPVKLAGKLTQANLPIGAGQAVATLTLTTGSIVKTEALQSAQAMQEPGMFWRLHR
jgi:D-alanyl-D-alanine carboxypeptidase (penicillin-binding protein 5/6)